MDPDEGVLLLMIVLPMASLMIDTASWAKEERHREEEGGGGSWDAEEQRERDQAEEDAIKQRARLTAEQRQADGLPPAWLRWMPPWAYKSLARVVGHHRLGPLQARNAELSEIMLGVHRRLRWRYAGMTATREAARRRQGVQLTEIARQGRSGRLRGALQYRALVEEKQQVETGPTPDPRHACTCTYACVLTTPRTRRARNRDRDYDRACAHAHAGGGNGAGTRGSDGS